MSQDIKEIASLVLAMTRFGSCSGSKSHFDRLSVTGVVILSLSKYDE